MPDFSCLGCGEGVWRATLRSRTRFCNDCFSKHKGEQWIAIVAVRKAVRRGELPKPSDCTCADCAAPATAYDHRDYTKPLDVAAVCWTCNQKRGPAFNSFWRRA